MLNRSRSFFSFIGSPACRFHPVKELIPFCVGAHILHKQSVAVEQIVAEILGCTGIMKQSGLGAGVKADHMAEQKTVKLEKKRDGEQLQKEMDQATMSLIADTMSAFRGS